MLAGVPVVVHLILSGTVQGPHHHCPAQKLWDGPLGFEDAVCSGSHLGSHLLLTVEQPYPCCSLMESTGSTMHWIPVPARPGTDPAPWRPLESSGNCWRSWDPLSSPHI